MKYLLTAVLAASLILTTTLASAQCSINVAIQQFPDTVCEGGSLTLSANTGTSGVTFLWTGPGNYNNTGQNITIPAVSINHTGTFKVVASKTGCPSDSDTVNIVVHAKPAKPTIQGGGTICIGDTLKLNLKPSPSRTGQTFQWWGPAGFSVTDTFAFIPNASKANTGNYFALATDTFGCVSDTAKYVRSLYSINTRPDTPVATAISPICKGDTLKISGSAIIAGQKYNWQGPASLSFNTKDISITNYTLTGRNRFILTVDSMGCHSAPDTADIVVLPTAPPKVTISADPGFIVKDHVQVTLTANPTDTGLNTQYQWKINGNDQLGETNKTFKVTTLVDVQQGDAISVEVVTGPTCNSTNTVTSAPVVINITLGVYDVTAENSIVVYPNPVRDMVMIKNIDAAATMSITNISGQVMQLPATITNDGMQLNTSSLPEGLYIIRSGDKAAKFVKRNQ